MNRYFISLLLCWIYTGIGAQSPNPGPATKTQLDFFKKYVQYSDYHIHPTYKHYFRYRTAYEMKWLLDSVKYNSDTSAIVAGQVTKDHFKDENWKDHKTKKKHLQKGATSTLKNYDQSGYPEIMYVPGSILCNSYSPYEKQFALQKFKRFVSSKLVTRMGMPRLNTYGDDRHSPFNDFLAEYYYNLLQDEEKLVVTKLPDSLYTADGKTYSPNLLYYNRIKMVRDKKELDSIDRVNKITFENWKSPSDTPHIITPMVMGIEGAQVLYRNESAKEAYILNPLNHHEEGSKYFTRIPDSKRKEIKEELLESVRLLKNQPHRLFFITLGHFAQNHVVGYAKTLDRDPENIQHRAVSTLTRYARIRNNVLRKTYDGFNPGCERTTDGCVTDSTGLDIVRAFLDTAKTKYKKPTYIDVKHMDAKARIQYYYMRRRYEKQFGLRIPIIASHFAVSGETQAMAVATGLWPNFDRYTEVEMTEQFYKGHILRSSDSARKKYWVQTMQGINYPTLNGKLQARDPFERGMYRPLDFKNNASHLLDTAAFDPFTEFKLDPNKVGWFYPWSINLFDEEIVEINKSDGVIGILLDPRQLGAYMPKYKDLEKKLGPEFDKWKVTVNDSLPGYGMTASDINKLEYFKAEPLLRNMFYIVQVIALQRELESEYKKDTTKEIRGYTRDDLFCEKDGWETIAIGGDFDGLIDPIDFAPTASYIPLMRKRMIVYAYIFAQLHLKEFTDPQTNGPFITSLYDSDLKMTQFFFTNLKNFVHEYF